jgi:capsular polysaccharide biosynthesis protein
VALTDRRSIPLPAVVRREVFALNVVGSALELLRDPRQVPGLLSDGEHLETACLLYNYWSSGYFHWTYESLARLEGVEQYREETGRTPTLVLGQDPPSWQRESLELLGYGPDDWTTWRGGRATVDRLVVPSVRRTTVLSPGAVQWLHDRVLARLTADDSLPDPGSFPDRVYVSRADAGRRRVVNEGELFDALADRGFLRFVLSDLSVPEQAALFAGADVVVAPHGAGLTNLTYADAPVVVELFRDGDVRGQYFQLANLRGCEYHYRVGDAVGSDMVVDVDDILAALSLAGVAGT